MTRSTDLRVIACPSLHLEHGRIDRYVPEGATVAGHLRAIGWQPDRLWARVFIDGEYIAQARWEYAVPVAGQSLTIRVVPMGGGEGGKTALRIVMLLAIVALSIWTYGAALPLLGKIGAGVLAAGISIAGSLAINALIPPARPRLAELSSSGKESPTLSLTGSSNQFAPYGVIPRVYGRHRIFPLMAARPFTEVVGNDQYLRLLFCCGYGPLALSDLKIGETPIAQFTGVEMEIRYGYSNDAPLTMIPNDVYEDNLSILLTSSGSWKRRTSQVNASELSVDVTFPGGVGNFSGASPAPHTVAVEVEYRLVGDVAFTSTTTAATVAKVTTNFSGANNDLVFTARTAGPTGNRLLVEFVPGSALSTRYGRDFVALPPAYNTRAGYQFPVLRISIVQGVTTSAAVKAAVEADVLANAEMIVTHAPSNTGAGTITLPVASFDRFIGTVSPPQTFKLVGGFSAVFAFTISDARTVQLRFSRKWFVPTSGQYDVRVRKVTADSTDRFIVDQVFWTTLRTVQPTSAVMKIGMCSVAMRIKATDQLNGVVDQFNCIGWSILPDWDGTSWQTRPTSNPASIYRDILQGTANKRPKDDDRLDLVTIQDFHERCAAQKFEYNAVIDFRTTVKQLRQDVLAVGRGAFGLRDMKYSVLQDLVQSSPIDVITPRTSSGFSWTKRFIDLPHAFKVRFVDEANNWQQGERFVYADGYHESNATIIEDVDAGVGVTNGDQVWKLKRMELAEALLRADDYTVQMDLQHLTFTRGDRVQLQHDVIMAGLLSSRIKTVAMNLLPHSEGFDNAIWRKTGATITANATTSPTSTTTADKLIEDTSATTTHYAWQDNVSSVAGRTYTFSVYAKADTRSRIRLQLQGGTGTDFFKLDFDLNALTTNSALSGGTGSFISGSILDVGNSWRRCSVTGISSITQVTVDPVIFLSIAAGSITYTGDGASGLFLWGAQLEEGASLNRYTPTTTVELLSEFTHDDLLTMGVGILYGVRVKRANGTQIVQQIITVPGESNLATFTVSLEEASWPAVGDLVIFGELGRESLDCIVKSIEMSENYAAAVHLLDYAPGIQTAHIGVIPPYTSNLTLPALDRWAIATPIIDQVQSDETVLMRDVDGSYQSRILVTLHFRSGFRLPVTKVQAEYRPTGSESDWSQIFAPASGTTTTVSIGPVEDRRIYDIRVRSIHDRTSTTSDWITIHAHTVIGKTTPPPNVVNVLYETNRLRWGYPTPPLDLDGFLVRTHPGTYLAWDTAVPLHDGIVTDTTMTLLHDTGVRTYLVKAIDTAGNVSAQAASVTVNLGDALTSNVVEQVDFKAAGFPGTVVNGTLSAGNLIANSTVLFWGPHTGLFWTSDAELFWPPDFILEMSYTFIYTPPIIWLDGTILLQTTVVAEYWRIEYRRQSQLLFWFSDAAALFWFSDAAALFWAPPGEWISWHGALTGLEREQYEFRIVTAGGFTQGVLSACVLIMDLPDVSEVLQSVAIGAGGTRLSLTKFYRFIAVVNATLQSGSTAMALEIVDRDATLGPLLRTKNSAGTLVAATLNNVTVQGY